MATLRDDDLYTPYQEVFDRIEHSLPSFLLYLLILIVAVVPLGLVSIAVFMALYNIATTGGGEAPVAAILIGVVVAAGTLAALECVVDPLVEKAHRFLVATIAAVAVTPTWLRRTIHALRSERATSIESAPLDPDTAAIVAKWTAGTFKRTWGLRRFIDGGRLRPADLLRILELERHEQVHLAELHRAQQTAEAAHVDQLVHTMNAAADALIAFYARAREAAVQAPDASRPGSEKRHGG